MTTIRGDAWNYSIGAGPDRSLSGKGDQFDEALTDFATA
jgi:hypothetical protein